MLQNKTPLRRICGVSGSSRQVLLCVRIIL